MFNGLDVSTGVDVVAEIDDFAPKPIKKSSAPIEIKSPINKKNDSPWYCPFHKSRPLAAEIPAFVRLNLGNSNGEEEKDDDDEKNANNESEMDDYSSFLLTYKRAESPARSSAAIAAIERALGMKNRSPSPTPTQQPKPPLSAPPSSPVQMRSHRQKIQRPTSLLLPFETPCKSNTTTTTTTTTALFPPMPATPKKKDNDNFRTFANAMLTQVHGTVGPRKRLSDSFLEAASPPSEASKRHAKYFEL